MLLTYDNRLTVVTIIILRNIFLLGAVLEDSIALFPIQIFFDLLYDMFTVMTIVRKQHKDEHYR